MTRINAATRDKIWVITGAGAGIGLAMARWVASRRGIVWALDMDEKSLAALKDEAAKSSWDVFTEVLDVTDAAASERIFTRIFQTSKRIDVWVNNAGIQKIGLFQEMSKAEFDRVMEVNLLAVIHMTREVTKVMDLQGYGVILNMASTAGHVPSPFMAAYVASKYGVVGFTRALQAEFELLRSPLRAAFASPGFVDTAIIARGKQTGFPDWLSWMLGDVESCAHEILVALLRGENEISPTLSGSLMRAAYAVAPKSTVRSSKMLLTEGFKDFLLNRYKIPKA